MAHEPVPAIEKILTDVDNTMRRRLAKQGLGATDHLVLALTAEGACIIRSNFVPAALREIAGMLVEIADQAEGTAGGKAH